MLVTTLIILLIAAVAGALWARHDGQLQLLEQRFEARLREVEDDAEALGHEVYSPDPTPPMPVTGQADQTAAQADATNSQAVSG